MIFDRHAFLADIAALVKIQEKIKHSHVENKENLEEEAIIYLKRVEHVMQALEHIENYQQALFRLAYDTNVSEYSSNPHNSPFHIAYQALGGKIENGMLMDNKLTIAQKLI